MNQWIFWAIVGVTVLQWIYGKAREQSEINRARKEREQRRQQALRTGEGLNKPGVSIEGTSAQAQTNMDLQARRQAQLRALRERQQQRMQQQSRTPARPTAPAQRQTPPGVPPRAPARAPSAPSQTQAQQAARARQIQLQREQQRRAAQQRAEQERRRADRAREEAERARERLEAQAAIQEQTLGTIAIQAPKAKPVAARSPVAPQTREDWRRAIVASEILARPLAMRESEA